MSPDGCKRARWAIYLALLLLRFLGVVQRGYVHPDEFYQGGAELFFGRHQEGDGTHQADGGGAERHLAKSVPWEFEPRHAVRSIVPPAFMTLLPLRAYVAARGLMGKILCNPPTSSSSRLCDALSVEASERREATVTLSQDSPLHLLWTPAMETLSGREVWLVPRLFMALVSVIFLDGSLWMMPRYGRLVADSHASTSTPPTFMSVVPNAYRYGPPVEAIVLASSWPCLVFGVRPFTNSLEAMVLAFLLMIANVGASSGGVPLLLLVGATCSIGIFVRFTFAFFAFPVVLIFLWNRFKKVECRLGGFLSDVLWVTLSFLIVSSAFVWADARYYSWQASLACGDSSCAETPSGIQNALKYVAPLNAFGYNSKSANLADHGLHPRITHAAVNMPMLFGPLALAMYASIAYITILRRSKLCRGTSLSMACQMSVLTGLLVLSCAPHQEPRFLLPALVPLVYLYGQIALGSGENQKDSSKAALALRLLWVVFNVILYAFFGWLHQGGLVPSLLLLPKIHAGEAVIFWKAYMPPTFLTQKDSFERGDAVCGANEGEATCSNSGESGEGVLLDLQGADSSVLLEALRERIPCPRSEEGATYGNGIRLISPQSVILPLVGENTQRTWEGYSFTPTQSFGGHISTEDWPAFDGSVAKFIDHLKLAVYEVSCAG